MPTKRAKRKTPNPKNTLNCHYTQIRSQQRGRFAAAIGTRRTSPCSDLSEPYVRIIWSISFVQSSVNPKKPMKSANLQKWFYNRIIIKLLQNWYVFAWIEVTGCNLSGQSPIRHTLHLKHLTNEQIDIGCQPNPAFGIA